MQLPTACRHGSHGHVFDVLAGLAAFGLVGADEVGFAGWVADLDGVEAPLGDGVAVVEPAA
ncbi:hypothetical protein [Saccharothrix sp. ALI-22-I]|uniref:hypothetical protein n=1 Tax=Saccharothrix sp. ALI-22-I TaxID=1933778 RepID=UPI00117B7E1D|nr:hypothetical protein [Saccharothrix sp. ALI-22-I]